MPSAGGDTPPFYGTPPPVSWHAIIRPPSPASDPDADGADADASPVTTRPARGLLDLTLPWSTLAGQSSTPGHLGRLGPITAPQARVLAASAAADPHAQWRVIITDDHGHATAVERVRRGRTCPRQPGRPPGLLARVTITIPAATLNPPPPLTGTSGGAILGAILRAARRAAARAAAIRAADQQAPGGCAHTTATPRYRPPPRLRELIQARDQTCRHPSCRQPAWRADLDHTTPWHLGGPTCPCNIGGFCRVHHQVKQESGWHVTQPRPGHFQITTPAGRTYHAEPHTYPE